MKEPKPIRFKVKILTLGKDEIAPLHAAMKGAQIKLAAYLREQHARRVYSALVVTLGFETVARTLRHPDQMAGVAMLFREQRRLRIEIKNFRLTGFPQREWVEAHDHGTRIYRYPAWRLPWEVGSK